MKKGLCILIICMSLITGLIVLMQENAREANALSTLEQTSQTETIFIRNSAVSPQVLADRIQTIADETGVAIVKTDYPADEQWAVCKYAAWPNGQWPADPFDLVEGNLPQTQDQFLATTETGDPNQTGRIRDLFQDQALKVISLNEWAKTDGYVDGSWTLVGPAESRHIARSRLAQAAGVPEDSLTENTLGAVYGEGPLTILMILACVLLAVYLLLCLFYPVTVRRQTGIEKLLGYSIWKIWTTMMSSVLLISLLVLAAIALIMGRLIPDLSLSLWCRLVIRFLAVMGLAAVISVLMVFFISRQTISDVIKGRFQARLAEGMTGLLKFAVAVAIVCLLPQTAEILTRTVNQFLAMQQLKDSQNDLVLDSWQYVDDEFQRFLSGDRSVQDKLTSLLLELTDTADAQYIWSYAGRVQDVNTPQEVIGNRNYMQRLRGQLPESLTSYYEPGIIHVLIPDTWTEEQQNQYKAQKTQTIQLDYPEEERPDLEFDLYSPDSLSIPAANPVLLQRGERTMTSPVIVFASDEWLSRANMLGNTGAQNPLRIKDTPANRKAIAKAIENAGLERNRLSFVLFGETMDVQLQGLMTGTGIMTVLLMVLFTVSLLSSCYLQLISLAVAGREIMVKKLLGFSLVRRYRGQFSLQTGSLLCSLILLGIMRATMTSWILYLLLLTLDGCCSLWLLRHQEQKQLTTLLKGEE